MRTADVRLTHCTKLTHRTRAEGDDFRRRRELFPTRPYWRRLRGTVTALSIVRCALTAGGCGLPQGPTGETDGPERNRAALRPSPAGRSGRRGSDQLAVGVGRLARGRRRRPLSCDIFSLRNPAGDVRERLRAADRASQLVVDFLTVQAEAGDTQLHLFMIAVSASNR